MTLFQRMGAFQIFYDNSLMKYIYSALKNWIGPDSEVFCIVINDCSLPFRTTALVQITAMSCDEVASDLGLVYGFPLALGSNNLLVTTLPQSGRKSDEKQNFKLIIPPSLHFFQWKLCSWVKYANNSWRDILYH